MVGNVAEWVADWFEAEYYFVSPVENPKGVLRQAGMGKKIVARWQVGSPVQSRCGVPFGNMTTSLRSGQILGFRCAKDTPKMEVARGSDFLGCYLCQNLILDSETTT